MDKTDEWIKLQNEMNQNVIIKDSFDLTKVKYVAGLDISFDKADPTKTCGYLTVVEIDTCNIVYEDYYVIKLDIPYQTGFLGFREVPVYKILYANLLRTHPEFKPDVTLIDGFGILHHRGAGSATHLGLELDIPTCGIAKTLLCIDELSERQIKKQFKEQCKTKGDYINLIGKSGKIHGVAFKSADNITNPIYISIGHKISLESAIDIVGRLCKYRIPEPIRNSDIKSKLHF